MPTAKRNRGSQDEESGYHVGGNCKWDLVTTPLAVIKAARVTHLLTKDGDRYQA